MRPGTSSEPSRRTHAVHRLAAIAAVISSSIFVLSPQGGSAAAIAAGGNRPGVPTAVRDATVHAFRCSGGRFYFPLKSGTIGHLYLDDGGADPYVEGSTTGLETGVNFRGIN